MEQVIEVSRPQVVKEIAVRVQHRTMAQEIFDRLQRTVEQFVGVPMPQGHECEQVIEDLANMMSEIDELGAPQGY